MTPLETPKKKSKETPKFCGHRLFRADRARLRRIAKKLRKRLSQPNESEAVRIAIKDLHDKLFTPKKK